MSVHIRSACESDLPHIAALVGSLSGFYLDDPDALMPEWLADSITIQAFQRRLACTDYVAFVCEVDNDIAGYICLKDQTHVYHLFVAERFQGQGVARALWNRALTLTGGEVITVRSSLHAVPVYTSFGFITSGNAGRIAGIAFQPMIFTRKPE